MRVSRRDERLPSLVRDEAALFLNELAVLPEGAFVTVTRVDLNEKRTQLTISVSLYPPQHVGAFMREIHGLEKKFHKHLKDALPMKLVPGVKFIFDDRWLKGEKLEKLLEDGKK